jgi:hypothetical protein
MIQAFLWLVVILGAMLAFILFGFHAFTGGSAFAAGIGAILPLVSGKSIGSLGVPNVLKTTNLKHLIETVMKEDFQK